MDIQSKKQALIQLGDFFRAVATNYENEDGLPAESNDPLVDQLTQAIDSVRQENAWFTSDSVLGAIQAWAYSLQEDKIEFWLKDYDLSPINKQTVGVIMAGNIPLVGLHDALCVLLCGHQLKAKISSKDNRLMRIVLARLQELFEVDQIEITEQLKDIDSLIATGSDNSARYFEYYFRDKKRIIRKNRTSVAIIDGTETEEELSGLSDDIFAHFGLGCRNVTKLYLPEKYNLDNLFKAFYKYKEIIHHNRYANNYDYNKAVYLMNKIELVENGFLLMKEDQAIHSPVGVLFYEFYAQEDSLVEILNQFDDKIQCIVGKSDLKDSIKFGKAQSPELWDYADGVDTIEYLLN